MIKVLKAHLKLESHSSTASLGLGGVSDETERITHLDEEVTINKMYRTQDIKDTRYKGHILRYAYTHTDMYVYAC